MIKCYSSVQFSSIHQTLYREKCSNPLIDFPSFLVPHFPVFRNWYIAYCNICFNACEALNDPNTLLRIEEADSTIQTDLPWHNLYLLFYTYMVSL